MYFYFHLRTLPSNSPTLQALSALIIVLSPEWQRCHVYCNPFFFACVCDTQCSIKYQAQDLPLLSVSKGSTTSGSHWQNRTRSRHKELWSASVRFPGIEQGRERWRMDGSRELGWGVDTEWSYSYLPCWASLWTSGNWHIRHLWNIY